MDRELEKKVEERIEDAIEKCIYEKASLIAELSCLDRKDIFIPKFANDKFKISRDHLTSIIYKGEQVYCASLFDVISYIPGEWEKEFEEIYIQVKERAIKYIDERNKRLEDSKEEDLDYNQNLGGKNGI